ncbi:MAG: His/Gly/Thr/Pro-type tRNA ligase C-terminal domain-containing protein, partial [Actinomycetota bacterium]
AGAFPLWLSPEQVRLLPVADRHVEYARGLAERFRAAGLRPFVDDSTETVGKKVRNAQLMKAPYTLVIGDKEIESGNLTVRDRSGTETKGVDVDAFIVALVEEAETKSLEQRTFAG